MNKSQAESLKVPRLLTPDLLQTWWNQVEKGQAQPDSAWSYGNYFTGQNTGARVFFEVIGDDLWICLPGVRNTGIVSGNENKDLFEFFLSKLEVGNQSIWLHNGFTKCAKELLPIVQNQLAVLPLNIKNIYIEGYSMGADIGAILWLLLKDQIKDKQLNLYLFMIGGSHILGWGQRWKLGDTDNILSFRNDEDIITHIPPKISPLGLYTEFVPFIQVGNYWNIISSFRGIFDYTKNAHYYDNYFINIKAKFFS